AGKHKPRSNELEEIVRPEWLRLRQFINFPRREAAGVDSRLQWGRWNAHSCPPCFLITSASSSLFFCFANFRGVSPFWLGTFTNAGLAFSSRSTTIASP